MPARRTKNRSAKKRRAGREERQGRGAASARFVRPDIHAEVRHITERAQAEDARIVTLGSLVFFSTRTRDAWLLDAEDDLALCLCRDGEPQPCRIVDTAETFSIEWTATFAIQEGVFVVHEKSGRVVARVGYPVAEIAAACGRSL